MGSVSTLDRIPDELRKLFRRLVRDGHTIKEITDKLNELGAEVSKSAVGRKVKDVKEEIAEFVKAQEIASQWLTQIDERPDSDVGRLLPELLKMIALQTLRDMQSTVGGGDPKAKKPKPMDLMLLAKSIRDLEATTKASAERIEKVERAMVERATKKVGEVGAQAGISQASIERIQQELRLL